MTVCYILLHYYEDDYGCDEVKLIGIYSSTENAEKAIERLRLQPGFRDKPNDFTIERYEVDKDHWTEGFVIV